jgi:hypothetical protein
VPPSAGDDDAVGEWAAAAGAMAAMRFWSMKISAIHQQSGGKEIIKAERDH